MKKSQTRGRCLVWLCGLALVIAGCDNPTNPTSPSTVPAPGPSGTLALLGVGAAQTASAPFGVGVGADPQTASALKGKRPGKVDDDPHKKNRKAKSKKRSKSFRLCHVTGSGTYVSIEVSESSVAAHMAHGDHWQPDGASCSPIDPPIDPLPVTLSCAAPTWATNPGSPDFPGPNVDTTAGGVDFEFAVTATPAPTSPTWIVRQILDTFDTGVHALESSVLLSSDGTYEGSIYTSGGVSFAREIRFTLDAASCSLFWTINPPPGS